MNAQNISNKLDIDTEKASIINDLLKKQLVEQMQFSGKLCQKNSDYLKCIQGSYLLMKKFISIFKRSNNQEFYQLCLEMQILCNDIDFKYMSSSAILEEQINDECFNCSNYGKDQGECKGMIGSIPCNSYDEKRISIATFNSKNFKFLKYSFRSLFSKR